MFNGKKSKRGGRVLGPNSDYGNKCNLNPVIINRSESNKTAPCLSMYKLRCLICRFTAGEL